MNETETMDIEVTHYSREGTVYFYGGPFSNFVGGPFLFPTHHCAFARPWGFDPLEYATVEHYFQAMKAASAEDHLWVRSADYPGEAKRRGHKITLREDWENVKSAVMLDGLRVKFRNPEFCMALLSTGDRQIAEDSPTDFVWGIRDASGGFTGRNLLGVLLMELRGELRG